jgi:hypothetical protein
MQMGWHWKPSLRWRERIKKRVWTQSTYTHLSYTHTHTYTYTYVYIHTYIHSLCSEKCLGGICQIISGESLWGRVQKKWEAFSFSALCLGLILMSKNYLCMPLLWFIVIMKAMRGILEDLERGERTEKWCNYIIISKNKRNIKLFMFYRQTLLRWFSHHKIYPYIIQLHSDTREMEGLLKKSFTLKFPLSVFILICFEIQGFSQILTVFPFFTCIYYLVSACLSVYLSACHLSVCLCTCLPTYMGQRKQLQGVSSLLSPCRSLEWNSGCKLSSKQLYSLRYLTDPKI